MNRASMHDILQSLELVIERLMRVVLGFSVGFRSHVTPVCELKVT